MTEEEIDRIVRRLQVESDRRTRQIVLDTISELFEFGTDSKERRKFLDGQRFAAEIRADPEAMEGIRWAKEASQNSKTLKRNILIEGAKWLGTAIAGAVAAWLAIGGGHKP